MLYANSEFSEIEIKKATLFKRAAQKKKTLGINGNKDVKDFYMKIIKH